MPAGFQRTPASSRYALCLLGLFAVVWTSLAVSPWYRQDWALENVLVVVAVPVLAWGWRAMPLTRLSYACLFVFGVVHEIGAHYTYAEVPYDAYFERVTGVSLDAALGLERNSFDRWVHLLYSLLVTPACVELLDHVAPTLSPTPGEHDPRLALLTEREREVLLEVATGATNAEIAQNLYMAEGTVKTHIGRLLTKLQARDRVGLVLFAYENGLAGR